MTLKSLRNTALGPCTRLDLSRKLTGWLTVDCHRRHGCDSREQSRHDEGRECMGTPGTGNDILCADEGTTPGSRSTSLREVKFYL